MNRWIGMVTAGLLLSGCGGGKDSQRNGEVPQAAARHGVNLGWDASRKGQLSDQDLVEIRAQLHQAALSNTRALDTVSAMKMEEQRAASAYSIAQIDQALEDLQVLQKKLLLRKAELEAGAK